MVIGYSNRNSVQTGKSDALCYLGIAVASDLILIQQLSKFICSTAKWFVSVSFPYEGPRGLSVPGLPNPSFPVALGGSFEVIDEVSIQLY